MTESYRAYSQELCIPVDCGKCPQLSMATDCVTWMCPVDKSADINQTTQMYSLRTPKKQNKGQQSGIVCHALSMSEHVSGTENGAERAENLVSGSGAGLGENEWVGAERGEGGIEIGFSTVSAVLPLRLLSHAAQCFCH